MKHPGDEEAELVRVPGSCRIDLVSSANGRAYRLHVALPRRAPPPGGWPALLVLDGDAYFGFATDVMRNRGELAGEISAFVVVAMGYPDDDPEAWHTRRVLDYTPCAPAEGVLVGDTGGLEGFLDTIEHDVLPMLKERFDVDVGRSALWGHSLGGLAVLAALLTRPGLVRSYLAVSPALWVAEADLLQRLQAFPGRMANLAEARRVHIAVGADEEQLPRHMLAADGVDAGRIRAQIARARMAGRARDWADRLRSLQDTPLGLALDVIAGESHVSVAYAALRPALDMAFGVAPSGPEGDTNP